MVNTGTLAFSSRSQVRASPPCDVRRLTLAQPSANVHRRTLPDGGIATQLVTRPPAAQRHRANPAKTAYALVVSKSANATPATPAPITTPAAARAQSAPPAPAG
jgi:hypothetical protein